MWTNRSELPVSIHDKNNNNDNDTQLPNSCLEFYTKIALSRQKGSQVVLIIIYEDDLLFCNIKHHSNTRSKHSSGIDYYPHCTSGKPELYRGDLHQLRHLAEMWHSWDLSACDFIIAVT